MSKKAKTKAKAVMETLDGDFNVCEYIATSDGTSSVIPSGNVRVTFDNGVRVDLYLVDNKLMVVGCQHNGDADEVLLTGGGSEGIDFIITARPTGSSR